MMKLKLDPSTIFEWQKFSQNTADVPHYNELLEFLDLLAQASKTCTSDTRRTPRSDTHPTHPTKKSQLNKPITSFTASTSESVAVQTGKAPFLYACPCFKMLPRNKMVSIIQENKLCMNCLKSGHFSRQCGSNNRCRKCQKPHHTLIHDDTKGSSQSEQPSLASAVEPVSSNAATGFAPNALLMTCQLLIHAPDGSHVKA